ncbi:MAG: hypothetical protein ONB54_14145 [candidate division KSB1 bacterium]|nr:hypothetical protein [candidate division KSB1 bacterium]
MRTLPALTVLLVGGLCLPACRLEPPQAPRWQANLTVPLVDFRYDMRTLIAEDDQLYAGGDSLVHFLAESQLDTFVVGERLRYAGFDQSFHKRYLTIPADTVQQRLSFPDFYAPSGNLTGQRAIIPPFPFALNAVPLPAYKGFAWVEVESGILLLHLHNELPVALGPPLHLRLHDDSLSAVLVDFLHRTEIPPGGVVEQRFDLSAKKFSNSLVLQLSGESPGSGGRFVTVAATNGVQVRVAVSDLRIRRVRLPLASFSLDGEEEIPLGDSLSVSRADIKSGSLSLNVRSSFPVASWMVATLPDFYPPGRAVLRDSLSLQPQQLSSFQLNLAGHVFRPLAAPFGRQKIRLHWRLQSQAAAQQEVTLTNNDLVEGNFTSTPFVFSRVRGRFQTKAFDLAPRRFALALPEGLDSLQLAAAEMTVTLRNRINFPLTLAFQIQGDHARQLSLQGQASPAGGSAPTTAQILLTEKNSTLAAFLSSLPHAITVRGRVLVGDATYLGSAQENDFVTGTLRLDAPLMFQLPSQKIEAPLTEVKIEAALRRELEERVKEGRLRVRVTNHLPVAAVLSLHLAARRTGVYSQPLLVKSLSLPAPSLDAKGRVVRPVMKETEIPLSAADLQVLQNVPLHAGVVLDLASSAGRTVRVKVQDYLAVQAVVEIATRMGDRVP